MLVTAIQMSLGEPHALLCVRPEPAKISQIMFEKGVTSPQVLGELKFENSGQ